MIACYHILTDWLKQTGHAAACRLRGLFFLGLIAVSVSGPAPAASVTYTYDALGRLTTATYSTGAVITYVYDGQATAPAMLPPGRPERV
jgi:hypothetical protein